jgi:hypothetical protein
MALLCPVLRAQPQQVYINTPDVVLPTGNTIQVNALNTGNTLISGLMAGTIDSTGAVSSLATVPSVGPQGIVSVDLATTSGKAVTPILLDYKRQFANLFVSYTNMVQPASGPATVQQIIPSSSSSWFQGTYTPQSMGGSIRIGDSPLPPSARARLGNTFNSGPVPIVGGLYFLSVHNESQADAAVTLSGWDATGANILSDSATIPAGATSLTPATVLPGVYSFLVSSNQTRISPNLTVFQSTTYSQQFSAGQWGDGEISFWGSDNSR